MTFLKQWQAVIRWVVTVVALGLILFRVDLRSLAAHIAGAELHWIAWSATLSVGVVTLMGVRWRCVLRACDVRVPYLQTISVTFIGQFFNAFLPGSTGGDVIKAWYATRWAPGRKAAPVVSVLYDRMTAILTLLIVTAAVLGIQTIEHAELRWLFNRFVVFAIVALLGTAGFAALAGFSSKRLLNAFDGAHPIQSFCKKHFRSCRLAENSARHFLAALAVSIPAHLLNIIAAWCVARAVSLDVTWLQIAVAVAFVNFSSVLPVSVGGHGVREAGFVFVFTLYGVLPSGPGQEAILAKVLAFSFLFFARSLISSLPGGLCYTIFRREHAGAMDAPPRTGLALH